MTVSESSLDANGSMTPTERLAWLQDRGVQVVTPAERPITQSASTTRPVISKTHPVDDPIIYVWIPSDPSKNVQQLSYDSSMRSFVEHLKPRFESSGELIDLSRLDPSSRHLLASGGGDGCATTKSATYATEPISPLQVSEDTLRRVAQEAHIETFTLVHSVDQRTPRLVLYLDEIGSLKHLPVNARAASYAARAGFNPPPTFYGDVYASRVCPRSLQHFNCYVKDLESIQEHVMTNLEHQLQQNQLAGRPIHDRYQPDVAGTGLNASMEDGFSWRQTLHDLEVFVDLIISQSSNNINDDVGGGSNAGDSKVGMVSSKQIHVTFRPQMLVVSVNPVVGNFLFRLHLFERVDVDSCTWTLESDDSGVHQQGQQRIVISMEKIEEALWPRISDV